MDGEERTKAAAPAKLGRLYRLQVVDFNGGIYAVVGSKGDLAWATNWLVDSPHEEWLRLSGFDDEADRKPISIVVARDRIAGMIFQRL